MRRARFRGRQGRVSCKACSTSKPGAGTRPRPPTGLRCSTCPAGPRRSPTWPRCSTPPAARATRLPLLMQALAAEPGNADAWFQQAEAQAALGALPDALASIGRVLALQPEAGPAWSRFVAGCSRIWGARWKAVTALKRALALGADVEINRYLLASLEGGDAPPLPPSGYVQALFDSYATGFDEQLVEKLQYRAPEQLLQEPATHDLRHRRWTWAAVPASSAACCDHWCRRCTASISQPACWNARGRWACTTRSIRPTSCEHLGRHAAAPRPGGGGRCLHLPR